MENDETLEFELEEQIEEEEAEETTDWKAEALKQKAINSRLLKKKTNQTIIKEEVRQKPSDILKADEFKLYRQGYTEIEIDLIMHNGGIKAIEDEKSVLAQGLKIAREQRSAEEAADKTSNASGLSEIERKYTPEQMKNMTTKELEDIIGFSK